MTGVNFLSIKWNLSENVSVNMYGPSLLILDLNGLRGMTFVSYI